MLVLVATEKKMCKCFEHWLRPKIRTLVTGIATRCDYEEMVDATLWVEKSLKGKRTSSTVSNKEGKAKYWKI